MKTNKEKLIEWIMESVDGCAKFWAGNASFQAGLETVLCAANTFCTQD